MRVTALIIREEKLKENWHSIGRLLDAIERRGETVLYAVLCELMHRRDLTRSACIGPFMHIYAQENREHS